MKRKVLIHILLSAAFIFHFFIITLYNIGNYKVQNKYLFKSNFVKSYTIPWFEQSWGMFAPTPPTSTISVLVQFKLTNSNGVSKVSSYYDLNGPIVKKSRKSIFSIEQRLLKYFHGCQTNTFSNCVAYRNYVNAHLNEYTDKGLVDYLNQHSSGYQSLHQYVKKIFYNINDTTIQRRKGIIAYKFVIINQPVPLFEPTNLAQENRSIPYKMEIGYNLL